MRPFPFKLFVPAILCGLLYSAAPAAQNAKALSLPQAERLAVELKKGMTLEEVQKLLGKPKRTSLRADTYAGPSEASPGTLQWTYNWPGGSQSDRTLHVVFASKSPERWLVNSWDWASY